jgi:hypothetical protein
MKALFSAVLVLAVLAIAIPTFAADCYKKCVSEKSVCKQYVKQCVQQGLKCIRTETICTSRDRRTGQCLSTQQRCAQYQQVCTQYKDVCVQYDKTCTQYQTVCPDAKPQPMGQQRTAPSGGKALDQLKAIDQGKDSIFDGGPGSTLNRR